MAGEITLDIAADTRSAVRGVKDLGKALDDVVEDLEDVGDEGKRTETDLTRTFRDISRASKRTGDDIRDDFRRAGKGADDFKDEANSSAREAAASFDGSAESIADLFQEVSANAFSGFGPAGAVAGLAAAGGIGLAVAGFEKVEEERQASIDRINSWADQMIESGSKVLSAAVVNANVAEIVTDTEGAFKTATENAKLWGVTTEDAVLAMAGHEPTLKTINESLQDQADKWVQITEDGYTFREGELKKFQTLQDGREKLRQYTDGLSAAAGSLDVYTAAVLNAAASTEGTTQKVDDLGNKLITFPDGTEVVIDVDTGQATDDLDEFKGDLGKIPDTTYADVRTRVDDSAVRNYRPPVIYIPARISLGGRNQAV